MSRGIPQDFASGVVEHERRTLRFEFGAGVVLGYVLGACTVAFLWLLKFWIDIGGLPYVSS